MGGWEPVCVQVNRGGGYKLFFFLLKFILENFFSQLKKQWNKLIVRENCHPAKTLIVLWGQIPLWICQSVALRNLVHMLPNPGTLQAKIIFTELTIGGFGWIPNLTEVDSSYILPVALGVINLSIIEVKYYEYIPYLYH